MKPEARPRFKPLAIYFLKIILLTLGGGLLGHYLVGIILAGTDMSLFLNRSLHLGIGIIFVWGPLLLIDGRWGIKERHMVWTTLMAAIRRPGSSVPPSGNRSGNRHNLTHER